MRNRIDLIFIKLSDYLSDTDFNFLSNYVTNLEGLLYSYIKSNQDLQKKIKDLRHYIDKLERSM